MAVVSQFLWRTAAVALVFAGRTADAAPAATPLIPLEPGLRLVSVLRFPDGDRENLVTIDRADARSVVYTWRAVARSSGARADAEFRREVRREDLATATRLNTAFRSGDQADYPGYTAFTISTASYQALVASGAAPFTLATFDDRAGGGLAAFGAMQSAVKFKGALSRVGHEDFPLILDGRRVRVPSIHASGRFEHDGKAVDREFWFLADAAHPLILRSRSGADELQMIRVDRPGATTTLESTLQKDCRADLAGIYFAFGSAALDADSASTLGAVAAMLARHADWIVTIEGHTDDIGTPAANEALSGARARAVRERLASAAPAGMRITARGFGASRPRETNGTLEGRARNRRVEIVRACRNE